MIKNWNILKKKREKKLIMNHAYMHLFNIFIWFLRRLFSITTTAAVTPICNNNTSNNNNKQKLCARLFSYSKGGKLTLIKGFCVQLKAHKTIVSLRTFIALVKNKWHQVCDLNLLFHIRFLFQIFLMCFYDFSSIDISDIYKCYFIASFPAVIIHNNCY